MNFGWFLFLDAKNKMLTLWSYCSTNRHKHQISWGRQNCCISRAFQGSQPSHFEPSLAICLPGIWNTIFQCSSFAQNRLFHGPNSLHFSGRRLSSRQVVPFSFHIYRQSSIQRPKQTGDEVSEWVRWWDGPARALPTCEQMPWWRGGVGPGVGPAA
jgi:hypothetical protein